MDYSELFQLWKKQKSRYEEWDQALRNSAEELRNEVESILKPKKTLKKKKAKTTPDRCVEIVNLVGEKAEEACDLSELIIAEDGQLVFGVSISFGDPKDDSTKDDFYVAVSVRFIKNSAHFSIFNPEASGPVEWEQDLTLFAEKVLVEFTDFLQFDPFIGAPKQRRIGFLKNIKD
jgi:hypothetical protein